MLTQKMYRNQKAALTRAINSGDPEKVIAACKKAVDQWADSAWPDDWHRWQIALNDAEPFGSCTLLESL